MVIKKFQGNTETQAILQAKEELGKDAIVMNIKTIKPKGLFKVFRKTQVEVTAAVDEAGEKSAGSPKDGKSSLLFNSKIDEKLHPELVRNEDETRELDKKLNTLAQLLEQQMENKKTESEKQGKKEAIRSKKKEERDIRHEAEPVMESRQMNRGEEKTD
ncbi:MAG: hypothetical protein IJ801_00830, partial [Lachnospiraceae bacterium]|nr:hypothetical protein [Lachnospiraceae bacterium]